MPSIPSIEFNLLEKGDAETVNFLENYLNDVGFFVIKNHPLPKSTIKDVFDKIQYALHPPDRPRVGE